MTTVDSMRNKLFVGTLFLANALVAIRVLFSFNPGDENAFWIVLGGMTALLVPGTAVLVAVENTLNIKPLDLIARSFLISMLLWLGLALSSFIFNFGMAVPCAAILIWNAIWLGFCFPKTVAFQRSSLSNSVLVVASILMVIFYRAADNLAKTSWETGLHLTYVRAYASGLALGVDQSALRPGLPPSNLFFLWEFMIGAAAYLSGSDILRAALRMRFMFPLLSIASYYFFLRRFLKTSRLALWVTAGVLVCAVLQLWDIPPFNAEAAADFRNGNYRGIGGLMPSFHHSDTAMEILLPILVGILFTFVFRPTKRAWFWVMISWFAAFFWHPREYFQIVVYFLVAALADLIIYGRHRFLQRLVKVYGPLLFGALAATLVLSSLVSHLLPTATEVNGRLELKQQAYREFLDSASHAATWLDFQWPLNFTESDIPLTLNEPGPPQKRIWMVLLALAFLPLAWKKPRRYQWIFVFLGLMWFLLIAWVPSQKILRLVTYEEIMVSKFRFFSVFAPGLSVLGLLVFFNFFRFALLQILVSVALGLAFWWTWFHPWYTRDPMIVVASVVGALGFAFALFGKGSKTWTFKYQPIALLCVGFFAAVVAQDSTKRFWNEVVLSETDVGKNYEDGNTYGFSKEFISHLRSKVVPRSLIQIEPDLRKYALAGVYAPVYVTPLTGTVQQDMPEFNLFAEGKHPIFPLHPEVNQALDKESVAKSDNSIIDVMNKKKVNYLYGRGPNVDRFKNLSNRHPDIFAVDFIEQSNQDILLRVLPVPPAATTDGPRNTH